MNKLAFFLLMLVLTSCNDNLELVSAKKQRIIPGFKSEQPYTNYQIEVNIKNNSTIFIDSIKVSDNNKCYNLIFNNI